MFFTIFLSPQKNKWREFDYTSCKYKLNLFKKITPYPFNICQGKTKYQRKKPQRIIKNKLFQKLFVNNAGFIILEKNTNTAVTLNGAPIKSVYSISMSGIIFLNVREANCV